MKDKAIPIIAWPDDFVSTEDESLFAFIAGLRESVRAKVVASQQGGLSLAEIVIEVREMVRLANEGTDPKSALSAHAHRGISRQAVAWCIETYQPAAFSDDHELVADTLAWNPSATLQLHPANPEATAERPSAK